MDAIFVYVGIAVFLFVISYIAKRRFGLLGLALATGSLLSGIWAYDAGLVAGLFGVPSNAFTSAIISSIIVLLPAVVLLFHGYTHKLLVGRIIGSCLFTLLALAFLVDPLGHVFVPQGFGVDVYNWVVSYRTMIIGAGLILAVVDLFLTKPASSHDKRR